jgi:hypothetical protein
MYAAGGRPTVLANDMGLAGWQQHEVALFVPAPRALTCQLRLEGVLFGCVNCPAVVVERNCNGAL